MNKERKYKLIGGYDEDYCLIYKLETELFVFVRPSVYEQNKSPEQAIWVSTNWISWLSVSDMEISFYEVSPMDAKAREIIATHEDYIEKQISKIQKYHKRDVKMIRAMANIMKEAEKDKQ